MHKLSTLINRLIETDDPEIVHDTRVACRRLQEHMAVLFPKPRTGKIRKLQRKLRRIRRLLGGWRNCDVVLKLLARESDAGESPATTKDAAKLVHHYLTERRSREIRRSRNKIEEYDRSDFGETIDKMLAARPGQDNPELLARVRAAQSAARQKWLSALAQAGQSSAPADVHRFRIATKRFRYRTELVHESGDDDQASILDSLKELQDLLGSWNDRQTLQRVIAEALADPELLLREPVAARILLQELEKTQLGQSKNAQEIIRFARANQRLPKEEAPANEPNLIDQEAG